jgi:hypothetical protein
MRTNAAKQASANRYGCQSKQVIEDEVDARCKPKRERMDVASHDRRSYKAREDGGCDCLIPETRKHRSESGGGPA